MTAAPEITTGMKIRVGSHEIDTEESIKENVSMSIIDKIIIRDIEV